MSKRTNKTASKYDERKLLERITRRYEQLDEQFEELESKFADLVTDQKDEEFRPTKPR
jgi:hypothetical protein